MQSFICVLLQLRCTWFQTAHNVLSAKQGQEQVQKNLAVSNEKESTGRYMDSLTFVSVREPFNSLLRVSLLQ